MQALTGLLPGRFLRIPITLVALFGAGFFEAACVSAAPPHKSAAQKQIGKTSITAAELRARVYETAERLGGFVEAAADDIRSKSSDPAARRNALLWKADGILALYAAAFRPDPFVGALDLWTLVAQMDLYFSEGAGKAAFGAEQSIAQAALGRMSALCEEAGAAIAANPEMLEHWRVEIQKFARAHSVEGSFSTRSTEAAQLAKFEASAGALAAVGRATETLSDITLRLDSYSTLMPKEIRWQGELLASEIAGRENLRSALDDVEAIGRARPARRRGALGHTGDRQGEYGPDPGPARPGADGNDGGRRPRANGPDDLHHLRTPGGPRRGEQGTAGVRGVLIQTPAEVIASLTKRQGR
jgi:hypothetical protein